MENEFKGTKGRWELSKPFDGAVLMNGNVKAQVLEYSAKKGLQEEDKANAQLISKAPEMLEKLIEIDTALKHNTFKENESYFRSTVEKLIKEATTN